LLFSFSIINAKGVQTKKYNHIVSLTLSGDEMLLGLVSENRIAGLSGKINEDKEISNIVDKAKKFPKVESNEEVLISLNPDLIIAADWITKKIDDIGATIGAKVYYYKTPSNYEEQKKVIRNLANLVEEKENGEKIIKNMDNRLKALQNKIAKNYKNVDKISKLFFEDPSFKNVKAIKNKKVYFMQYKDITPISQYMIDGIEELAKVVYQFKE